MKGDVTMDDSKPTGSYQEFRPSLMFRFWNRLGFHMNWVDFGDDPPGAHNWGKTVVKIRFGWGDRLRLLLTGNARIEIEHRTDVPITIWKTVSSVGVMRPGYKEFHL